MASNKEAVIGVLRILLEDMAAWGERNSASAKPIHLAFASAVGSTAGLVADSPDSDFEDDVLLKKAMNYYVKWHKLTDEKEQKLQQDANSWRELPKCAECGCLATQHTWVGGAEGECIFCDCMKFTRAGSANHE